MATEKLPAKGTLLVGTGTKHGTSGLAVGTDGYAVVADSTQPLGLKYVALLATSTTAGSVSQIDVGDAASAGASGSAAAVDHQHPFPGPTTVTASAVGDTSTVGASTKPALEDHKHAREAFGSPVASAPGDTASDGTGTTVARATHRHAREAAVNYAPTGALVLFGGSAAPTDWLLCDGSAVSRTTYAALFAVIGTSYGVGDGSTTFNLPDLRDRFPVGKSATKSLASTSAGATSTGAHALTSAELAAHNHGVSDPTHSHTVAGVPDGAHTHTLTNAYANIIIGTTNNGLALQAITHSWTSNRTNAFAANGNTNANAETAATAVGGTTDGPSATSTFTSSGASTGVTTTNTGSGTAHSHTADPTPPYVAVNYIIKT